MKIILEIKGKRYSLKENQISSDECPDCGRRRWIISSNNGKTRVGCTNPECSEYTRKPSELSNDVRRAKQAYYGRR